MDSVETIILEAPLQFKAMDALPEVQIQARPQQVEQVEECPKEATDIRCKPTYFVDAPDPEALRARDELVVNVRAPVGLKIDVSSSNGIIISNVHESGLVRKWNREQRGQGVQE